MEHNDDTDKDLPADPDATEVVSVDLEAMLHMELDAERASKAKQPVASARRPPSPRPAAGRPPRESIATVRAMRAAPRVSTRMSARMPVAPGSPRPPIHTLLPPSPRRGDDYEEDTTTHQMPRASAEMKAELKARASVPSIRPRAASVPSVAFPPPSFSMPAAPQPFNTVPAIPVAKRADASASTVPKPDDSQRTSFAPLMAPTSRRDISLNIPKAMESLAPMAMSAFPSALPPAATKMSHASLLALMLTLIFTLGTVGVMGVGVFKPTLINQARIAVVGAMKGNQKHAPQPVAAAKAPEAPVSVQPAAVPPVLLDDAPAAKDAGAN